MSEADRARVLHILDAARQSLSFVHGRGRADLDCDLMLQHALVRLLEVIGEAAKGVSTEARSAHPNVPWREMAGMRDRLIEQLSVLLPGDGRA